MKLSKLCLEHRLLVAHRTANSLATAESNHKVLQPFQLSFPLVSNNRAVVNFVEHFSVCPAFRPVEHSFYIFAS